MSKQFDPDRVRDVLNQFDDMARESRAVRRRIECMRASAREWPQRQTARWPEDAERDSHDEGPAA
jgi:hypothetical protein